MVSVSTVILFIPLKLFVAVSFVVISKLVIEPLSYMFFTPGNLIFNAFDADAVDASLPESESSICLRVASFVKLF